MADSASIAMWIGGIGVSVLGSILGLAMSYTHARIGREASALHARVTRLETDRVARLENDIAQARRDMVDLERRILTTMPTKDDLHEMESRITTAIFERLDLRAIPRQTV